MRRLRQQPAIWASLVSPPRFHLPPVFLTQSAARMRDPWLRPGVMHVRFDHEWHIAAPAGSPAPRGWHHLSRRRHRLRARHAVLRRDLLRPAGDDLACRRRRRRAADQSRAVGPAAAGRPAELVVAGGGRWGDGGGLLYMLVFLPLYPLSLIAILFYGMGL